jgi:hypothetical protein
MRTGWIVALVVAAFALLVRGCVVPETVGYTDDELGGGPGRPTGPDNNPSTNVACGFGPPCADYEECCDGLCVLEGGCVSSVQCAEHGERCDLPSSASMVEQEGFICARTESGQTGGQCIQTCAKDFSIGGCPTGSFCLATTADGVPLTLCIDSECATSAECGGTSVDGGSCIDFGNETGFCFPAGVASEGDDCSPGGGTAADVCARDLFCVAPPGELRGACQPLCDLWSDTSICSRQTACGFLTFGQGVCRPRTEYGREVFEECGPEYGWCSGGIECLDFNTGGESLPVCTAYCRPRNSNDCVGAAFTGRPVACTAVFTGSDGDLLEDIGLCL